MGIASDGFHVGHAKNGRRFGDGVYLAEDLAKSLAYCDKGDLDSNKIDKAKCFEGSNEAIGMMSLYYLKIGVHKELGVSSTF